MCLYVFTYTLLFIYEKQLFDPGEVLYLYESPAGYGLIALRLIAWWIFLYSTIFTLRHYPEKSEFYYTFKVIGSLWFVSGPAFVLISNSLIDKWVRESVFFAVSHVITLAGHILFLVVTLPYNANKNFPYHVRTTQIAAMELCGSAGTTRSATSGTTSTPPGGRAPPATAPPRPPPTAGSPRSPSSSSPSAASSTARRKTKTGRGDRTGGNRSLDRGRSRRAPVRGKSPETETRPRSSPLLSNRNRKSKYRTSSSLRRGASGPP
ncbi:unnamed protein product [Bemisia tabaci]|uniref:GPR180/TMEM145 transmembrane domain-containing protein n=1 Tax=Bemisia tabaci TaxID=7038 RepID=A0A9P0A2V2_BEMTA|nr:unnamed protein product [Bemisia tabaci]